MYRYILSTDITDEVCSHYKFSFINKPYGDNVDGMPIDDDTNYVVTPVLWRMLPHEMRRDRREFFPNHAGKGSLLTS